ncbi:MAG TPA: hypothetical protein VMQ73_01090, partial [Methylomirabilota bacterium]|nr:hypothetical protein [Methylomirabilota bacterium]
KAVVPLPASQAADVLRANVLTIIGATTRTELAPLQVALPTPVSSANYKDDLLQQLIVSLYFTRPGPVAPGLETTGPNPILVKSTVLAPFQDQPPPLGYQQFATDMEAVLAPLGMRVMAGDLDVPGGAKFWLLRWQGNGLQVGFKPGGMGFAPTPIATSLQSRQGIQPSLFTTAGYNFQPDFFITNPLNPTNMDMDSVLSSFLTAVETFLSPEYAIPAAIAAGPQVDACIAHKQTLAQELAARVVPLAETDADPALLAAATTKYQQACLLDLRNFYAVDADAAVNVTVTAPQTPPDLIVYGHFTLPQGSDIMVSAGQSRISDTDPALAVSLSARHKGWEASFELPTDFRVEALELVTGTISVTDPDEPSGQPRKYVVGTWLRFVTDSDLDLTLASPPTIPLPLRSYPAAPVLSAQSYAQIPGTQLESVKSWSFDCTYLHQPAAQDTVHITAELNGPPKAVRLMATRGLDLLDGLALFQAIYPPISAEFDAHLRLGTSGPTSTTLDAITNFVLLVQCIAENFAYVPTGGNALGGPPGFKFALNEFATDGDPDWQATLTAGANQVSNWTCPLPIVTIDQTPTGEVPTADTVYQSKLVDPVHNLYKFYNGANDALTTVAAVGNSIRSLQIQPLDIVDWHSGRYYLQIIRNETMPLAFRYVTPVIGAKDAIHPLIDNANADVDLSGLPPIPYKNTPPPPGSFGDFLARLYYALLNGQIKDPNPPSGGMRTEVSLSYPLGPAGPPGATPFPDVRVPITLQLVTTSFQFYPSADQAWAMAQPVATAVTTWMQNNNVTASQRPALYASAQFDVTVTVFSAVSTTSLPMIYLDGLYLALTKVSG